MMRSRFREIMAVFVLTLVSFSINSNAGDVATQTTPQSIEQFLTPDGRIDLEKARELGFQGSLDISGFNINFDPATNEPILEPLNSERHPDDIYWTEGFSSVPGIIGSVRAMTIYNGKLIIGGNIYLAGNVFANNIVSWDGSNWDTLGSGLDYGIVYDLTVYNDMLIAGGSFSSAGGVLVNHIASWDGFSWDSLGSGMGYGEVRDLAVYDNKLIAGGRFNTAGGDSMSNIASWDGSNWESLASGVEPAISSNDGIYALTVYDNALIVGGSFTTAGGDSISNIASWDGSDWDSLGSGTNGYVSNLMVYDNKLIVAGGFDSIGAIPISYIASWDGSNWDSLGLGISGGYYLNKVDAMTIYDNKLIIGGSFTSAGEISTSRIASWDGYSWDSLGSGIDGYKVYALTVYNNRLITGGQFTTAGEVPVKNIAAWDNINWSWLGSGMNNSVLAMTVYDNKLICGGYFDIAGGVLASRIASWDGSTWDSLGSGISGEVVRALTVFNDELIVGGNFTAAGDVPTINIASWDGISWDSLASGITPVFNFYLDGIHDMTVYDNKLICGGSFDTAGSVPVNGIASWDGFAWDSLGSGVISNELHSNPRIGHVSALTVYNDKLYVGGAFTTAGGISAGSIASWDGDSWDSLGSGMPIIQIPYPPYSHVSPVYALTVYNNTLIAGGEFTSAGGVPAENIASWNGFSWNSLGPGISNYVISLTVYNRELIAGIGDFNSPATIFITSWNGHSWSSLGSGIGDYDTYVSALMVYENNLMVGGYFLSVGDGKVSPYIAQWTKPYEFICGDVNSDFQVNILDVIYLIQFLYYEASPPDPYPSGDVSGNCVVNILDITYLIQFLYQGGPSPSCECP